MIVYMPSAKVPAGAASTYALQLRIARTHTVSLAGVAGDSVNSSAAQTVALRQLLFAVFVSGPRWNMPAAQGVRALHTRLRSGVGETDS
jgi:hypothetical protein